MLVASLPSPPTLCSWRQEVLTVKLVGAVSLVCLAALACARRRTAARTLSVLLHRLMYLAQRRAAHGGLAAGGLAGGLVAPRTRRRDQFEVVPTNELDDDAKDVPKQLQPPGAQVDGASDRLDPETSQPSDANVRARAAPARAEDSGTDSDGDGSASGARHSRRAVGMRRQDAARGGGADTESGDEAALREAVRAEAMPVTRRPAVASGAGGANGTGWRTSAQGWDDDGDARPPRREVPVRKGGGGGGGGASLDLD